MLFSFFAELIFCQITAYFLCVEPGLNFEDAALLKSSCFGSIETIIMAGLFLLSISLLLPIKSGTSSSPNLQNPNFASEYFNIFVDVMYRERIFSFFLLPNVSFSC